MADVNALGSVLKNVGNYEKMATFEARLKLQKTVYLMQAFDLYLGYDFNWYIRGPYCPELTRDGYSLINVYDTLSNGQFSDLEAQERFEAFSKFVAGHEHDADWLEIVASIHFLKRMYPQIPKSEILQIVKNKQEYFTLLQCEDAWSYLERWGKLD
jgi:uncharacterized protein YwgA